MGIKIRKKNKYNKQFLVDKYDNIQHNNRNWTNIFKKFIKYNLVENLKDYPYVGEINIIFIISTLEQCEKFLSDNFINYIIKYTYIHKNINIALYMYKLLVQIIIYVHYSKHNKSLKYITNIFLKFTNY